MSRAPGGDRGDLGHRQVIGRSPRSTVAGAAMLRIAIPSEPPGVVIAAPASLYCITPIDEETARRRYARPPELTVADEYTVGDFDDDYELEHP